MLVFLLSAPSNRVSWAHPDAMFRTCAISEVPHALFPSSSRARFDSRSDQYDVECALPEFVLAVRRAMPRLGWHNRFLSVSYVSPRLALLFPPPGSRSAEPNGRRRSRRRKPASRTTTVTTGTMCSMGHEAQGQQKGSCMQQCPNQLLQAGKATYVYLNINIH